MSALSALKLSCSHNSVGLKSIVLSDGGREKSGTANSAAHSRCSRDLKRRQLRKRNTPASHAFNAALVESTQAETRRCLYLLKAYGENAVKFGRRMNVWKCPLCPTQNTTKKNYLVTHIEYHLPAQHGSLAPNMDETTNLVVYGTRSSKQRVVMKRLWNQDQVGGAVKVMSENRQNHTTCCLYLERSASVMREQLERSPSWRSPPGHLEKQCTRLDEEIITLLDRDTTSFILANDLGAYSRISSKYRCADEFLQGCLSAMIHPDTTSVASFCGDLKTCRRSLSVISS